MGVLIDRRSFLRAGGVGMAACALPGVAAVSTRTRGATSAARSVIESPNGIAAPKALVFDTFGTIVDWRGSIIEEGTGWGKQKGLNIDWGHFADRWRAGYQPAMAKVRSGELLWTKLDDLHRMILENLLKEFNIPRLTEEEKDDWTRVWHRLKPWPDSVAGLTRLRRKFIIAPLSNGNVSLLTDLAKHDGLPWDLILSAELAKHYKPDRESYLTAVELLSLKAEEVMMVAAHVTDLNAARGFGLQTGFIYRPHEFAQVDQADRATPGQFDVVAEDTNDMASKMGA
jgi:2-haloacid dehalogenase